ncbi:MAG: phosphoribosylanthranilate isomerase [Lachnospiraceae bacterium]|nr:phosphoribosylanthranilate isomerase [Lachnospiraceae bacterium]
MITQIYSMKSVEEAMAVIEAGADYIGIAPPQCLEGGVKAPGEISEETCFAILEAARGLAKCVMIVSNDDEDYYCETVRKYKPDIIQITGRHVTIHEKLRERIKKISPDILIMQAVCMDGEQAIGRAKEFAKFSDLLILDSAASKKNFIGAAGVTHNWDWDREIIESVEIPVIIAGGLGVDNVAAAIEKIHPFGVDSLTRTNSASPEKKGRKDIELVREFCRIAHSY